MDKISRFITKDGDIVVSAIDTSNIVYTAQKRHGLTKTTSAALGRLLTGTALMGAQLKDAKSTLAVTINGGGPIGNMVAKSDYHGNVRGYVENPDIDLPIRPDGKIDVGAAVGKDGRIAVIRDDKISEPYIGHVELVSGEIAEDITAYLATSEQIPSVCALGVLVDKDSGEVMLSGGLLIQVLPFADERSIERLEETTRSLESVTTMLAKGITPEEMCTIALEGFEIDKLDEYEINYVCNCSKERFAEMLLTLPPKEITTLPLVKDNMAETYCQYCGSKYYFTKEELEDIAKRVKADIDSIEKAKE